MQNSLVAGVYEKLIDRESAYELIKGRTQNTPNNNSQDNNKSDAATENKNTGWLSNIGNVFTSNSNSKRMTPGQQLVKSAASAIGREVGRQILRGVLGSIMGKNSR
jgi:hypothetical protein